MVALDYLPGSNGSFKANKLLKQSDNSNTDKFAFLLVQCTWFKAILSEIINNEFTNDGGLGSTMINGIGFPYHLFNTHYLSSNSTELNPNTLQFSFIARCSDSSKPSELLAFISSSISTST